MDTNKYVILAKPVLKRAKSYLKGNWIFVSKNERGTTLHKQTFSDVTDFSCFKVETVLNKPVDELVSKVWDVTEDTVKLNDPEISSWCELEKGSNWKVCHQFNSVPMPLYTREFLFTQVKFEEELTTWLVATSIKEHTAKKSAPYWSVRAIIHMSVWAFTPLSANQTKVTRIVHVDPAGLIPVGLVDSTIGKHVKIIEKYGE
jgi:hypothetical protein